MTGGAQFFVAQVFLSLKGRLAAPGRPRHSSVLMLDGRQNLSDMQIPQCYKPHIGELFQVIADHVRQADHPPSIRGGGGAIGRRSGTGEAAVSVSAGSAARGADTPAKSVAPTGRSLDGALK
jgi:hypothetical protein